MALNNITTSDYSSFYWYQNAAGNLDGAYSVKAFEEDSGKANTIRMKAAWDVPLYGDKNTTRDLWSLWSTTDVEGVKAYTVTSAEDSKTYKMVSESGDGKWFIPSRAEWSAFGDYLYTNEGVTKSNYPDFGLSDGYWSSSQYGTGSAWGAYFDDGYVFNGGVGIDFYVRLCATF